MALPCAGTPRGRAHRDGDRHGRRSDKPVTSLDTRATNQHDIAVLDGTAVVWRDPVVAAANGAQHHQQELAGQSGDLNRKVEG